MALDSPEIRRSDVVSQISLNYTSGDTVQHSLLLLEGELLQKKFSEGDGQKKVGNVPVPRELPSLMPNEILVHQKDFCHRWPIIEGKFKAFVKLDRGENWLKIVSSQANVQKEISLIYEEQKHQPRYVRMIYIKCCNSDGYFDSPDKVDNSLEAALQKLQFNGLLLQTFMAMEMNRHGFGYQTFRLEENEDGCVVVHVFTSQLKTEEAHQMSGGELYNWFLDELTGSSLNDPNCKFLAFMSCSHYDPPEQVDHKKIPQYVKAHTALGGGKLGLFGTAGLHTWAKNVGELISCFTDGREIDTGKLFDDSAGRGTFWANYSTTLGASLHELGHCFDLMHMPQGIMSRGFDDMNHFVLMTSPTRKSLPEVERCSDLSNVVAGALAMFADHRAHWFRSSAVLLHYHKWLRPLTSATAEKEDKTCLHVSWSSHVKGPVGNGDGGQENLSYFDDIEWRKSRGISLIGYAVYHSDYIDAIKPLAGVSHDESDKECPLYGKIHEKSSHHTFWLEEDEILTALEIRAGAWVDGIRFHTNLKSSIWFGGRGGNWCQLTAPTGNGIVGIFGTFGDFVGSLGIRVNSRADTEMVELSSSPVVKSAVGIGLVELRYKEELINFWEFLDGNVAHKEFKLPPSWLQSVVCPDQLSIMAVDIEGNICKTGFAGYTKFVGETLCSEK